MNTQDQLADLRAQYAAAVREAQSALTQLSASVFNHPQLHDSFRSSSSFQHWHSCRERSRLLEQWILQLEQGVAPAQVQG